MLETAGTGAQEGRAGGEVRELIGAVDETFLERMLLVFADLPAGYLVREKRSQKIAPLPREKRGWTSGSPPWEPVSCPW